MAGIKWQISDELWGKNGTTPSGALKPGIRWVGIENALIIVLQ
jgi:hypothetical protein